MVLELKRERMVYDEADGKWKPNWGYKSKKNEEEDDWAIEMKANAPDDFNPWADRKKLKRANVEHNEKKRAKNKERAMLNKAKQSKAEGRDVPVVCPSPSPCRISFLPLF